MQTVKTACLALPLLVIPLGDAAAARPTYSWGKSGVSRTDYDADAVTCSLQAATRDVERDREAQDYVRGANVLDRENNLPPMARPSDEEGLIPQANRNVLLRRAYSPDRKVDALQAKLQGEVEACLTGRGYTRFQLSRDQSKQLKKFRVGSKERRDFLYGLGSSGTVLLSQRVDMAVN